MKLPSTALSRFGRDNWLPLSVFAIAIAVALWFAVHVLMNVIYFNDPRNVDVDLREWMTPRFIVMTYDLPKPLVFEFLGLQPGKDDNRPLWRVAEDLGVTMDQLTDRVRDRAEQYRETHP
ncbi:hypothetical protein [Paracoccus sp. JM45]|uniref:hypothetical protein n=1 Tax=Paracoccus sp. JM45 TaxID=2283626 RepID=UPI000E6C0B24|nr:hypothetical protein [Paracoccus sp. JM45]RJE78986.1 hypothetical protein DWB67_14555 [Paracoccus sp. JM45]